MPVKAGLPVEAGFPVETGGRFLGIGSGSLTRACFFFSALLRTTGFLAGSGILTNLTEMLEVPLGETVTLPCQSR